MIRTLKRRKKRILVVADIPNWAFDKIYRNLKKYSEMFDYYVYYLQCNDIQEYTLRDHRKFDLIFYLCDYNLSYLMDANIPREKVILAIRSHVKNEIYKDKGMIRSLCSGIAVANKMLYEEFKDLHEIVELVPGGVDIDIFRPEKTLWLHNPLIVGWAGSNTNMNDTYFRGIDMVTEACHEVNYIFNPALREDKWRTEKEMVKYYNTEIDIYVDMSISAGRQNGLIEAGACKKALISTHVGIADQLIEHEKNGLLVERNKESLIDALKNIKKYINFYGRAIRKEIEQKWAWHLHVKYFEDLFIKVLSLEHD